MKNTMTKSPVKSISVDGREILFMRQNAPKRFTSLVTEALEADGHSFSRVKVHTELNTIKDSYNKLIIDKARQILKHVYQVEYNPE